MISANQRTQGNKGRKGISLKNISKKTSNTQPAQLSERIPTQQSKTNGLQLRINCYLENSLRKIDQDLEGIVQGTYYDGTHFQLGELKSHTLQIHICYTLQLKGLCKDISVHLHREEKSKYSPLKFMAHTCC